MKKAKKVITAAVILTLIILLSAATTFAYFRLDSVPYDKENPDTYYDENNVVFEWEASKVRIGMTYEEVISAIGKANMNIGIEYFIPAYACFGSERVLAVTFTWAGGEVDDIRFYDNPPFIEQNNISNADQMTFAAISIAVWTVVVLGGYAVLRLCRKKKADLQVPPEEAPDPGEAQ